jgi:uncharacterized protein YndB with AHSA1/START domain
MTEQTEQGYGALRLDGDRAAVRFERRYEGSPAEIWAALTEPDRVRRWLADVIDGQLEPGGEFTFRWNNDANQTARCLVRVFTPPRALEMDWCFVGEPPSLLRIELSPAGGGGTLLVLDHRQLPMRIGAGYGAGWHAHLAALADFDLAAWDARFAQFLPAYQEQAAAFG